MHAFHAHLARTSSITSVIRDSGYNEFFSRDCSDAVLLPSLTFKCSGVVGGGHGISATRPFVRGQNKSCFPDACPHLCVSWYATKLFLSGFLSLFFCLISFSLSRPLSLFQFLSLFLSLCLCLLHCFSLSPCNFVASCLSLSNFPLCCTHVHFVTITVRVKPLPFHSQALSLPPVSSFIHLVLIPVFMKHMPLHSRSFSHAKAIWLPE